MTDLAGRLRALSAEATPGPWHRWQDDLAYIRIGYGWQVEGPTGPLGSNFDDSDYVSAADAALIVAARSLLDPVADLLDALYAADTELAAVAIVAIETALSEAP